MNIVTKEIIDEIISLEPGLKNDREKLEKILENFINIKPNTKISFKFKEELKNELLLKIKGESKLDLYKKTNLLKLFISFIFGGITVFSLIGILGINFNILNIGEIENTEIVGIQQFKQSEEISINRDTPDNAELGVMMMKANNNIEEEDNIITDNSEISISKSMQDNNDVGLMMMAVDTIDEEFIINETDLLYIELETYLIKLGLNKEIIEEIINIVKKYN